MRILVVDDDVAVRRSLSRLLGQGIPGALIVEEGTVRAALARLAGQPFDVVLLDLHIGSDNGVRALEQVKKLRRETIVFIVSCADAALYGAAAARLGAAGFIPKEQAPALLVARIRSALPASPA